MSVKDFIQVVLIKSIKEIQRKYKHHYISFILIASGIEFLGACLDTHKFGIKNKSSERFRKAIKELFPKKYHKFNQKGQKYDLYTNLRCGMLHIVLPKSDIELTHEAEASKNKLSHLKIDNIRGEERLVLVAEDLFDDFEKACLEIIRRIDNKELSRKVDIQILETTLR